MNLVHGFSFCLPTINFIVFVPSAIGSFQAVLSVGFSPYGYDAFLFLPTPATSPVHVILLDLFTLMTFGEEYKSRNSTLCIFLCRPFTPSVLPKYVPQHPIH
jgi:hypothetical protein